MLRKVLFACVALVICLGVILADEYKGKVEKVDADKKVVSVKAEGKEKAKNFTVGADTKVTDADGKEVKDLKALDGKNVVIDYEKGDKEKKIPTKVKSIKIQK
jgi:uncharacterized transporter YbjL